MVGLCLGYECSSVSMGFGWVKCLPRARSRGGGGHESHDVLRCNKGVWPSVGLNARQGGRILIGLGNPTSRKPTKPRRPEPNQPHRTQKSIKPESKAIESIFNSKPLPLFFLSFIYCRRLLTPHRILATYMITRKSTFHTAQFPSSTAVASSFPRRQTDTHTQRN